jgi:hypothetical protein
MGKVGVMSKERELLKRHCNWKLSVEEHLKLLRETEALLAQPERIEQEPVAWKVVDKTTGKFMFLRVKPTTRAYKYGEGINLYTSPQKREPLSYSRTADLFHANKKATNAVCYWAGVSDAEKYHGITGETK